MSGSFLIPSISRSQKNNVSPPQPSQSSQSSQSSQPLQPSQPSQSSNNIIVIISEIYKSLKRVEGKQEDVLGLVEKRLDELGQCVGTMLSQINVMQVEILKMQEKLDVVIKNNSYMDSELSKKMGVLKNIGSGVKLELDPVELTVENIIENNYTLDDLNNVIERKSVSGLDKLEEMLINLPLPKLNTNNDVSADVSGDITAELF